MQSTLSTDYCIEVTSRQGKMSSCLTWGGSTEFRKVVLRNRLGHGPVENAMYESELYCSNCYDPVGETERNIE